MFSPTSRYQALPTAATTLPDGRIVKHVRRRMLPDPDSLVRIGAHRVVPGDRLDRIAADEIGDPTLFWRIADAERELDPSTLADDPGRVLPLTLPAGIGGVSTAVANALSSAGGNRG